MRKASDPKAPSPLPSFVVRTYQLGSLEFLPLSSTLSAADARKLSIKGLDTEFRGLINLRLGLWGDAVQVACAVNGL